jgi:large subunit ribosomal protein L31
MKPDIHPKYFKKASVRCACGNAFTVGSTSEFIETEVCAKCHPFYTKQEKVMDTLEEFRNLRKDCQKRNQLQRKKFAFQKQKKK